MLNDLHNNYDMMTYKNVETANKDLCYRSLVYWSQSYKTNSYLKKHPRFNFFYKIHIKFHLSSKRGSKLQQKKRLSSLFAKPFSTRKNKDKKMIIPFFRRERIREYLNLLNNSILSKSNKNIDFVHF